MIAFISIFLPAIIAVVAFNWNRNIEPNKRLYYFVEYIIAVLAINMFNIAFLRIFKHYSENLCEDLNNFSIFALEYICLSLAVGIAIPYLFVIDGGKVEISFDCKKTRIKSLSDRTWHIIAMVYGFVLIAVCFIRLFDNYFWGDETYSIMMAKMSMSEMLSTTATDVHPPLYYMFVMLLYKVFGEHGWVYHLSAFLPYLCIIVISLTIVWKRFGKETAFLLMTFCSFLNQAVKFNVEVRMYSLAELAIFVAFLELLPILKKNTLKRHYVAFVVFSLIAAYSHYYALVAVAFFYVVIIIDSLFNKEKVKSTIIICFITIIAYIPWLAMMIGNVKKTTEEFWLYQIPSFQTCLISLFEVTWGKYAWYAWVMLALLVMLLLYFVIQECGAIRMQQINNKLHIILTNNITNIEKDTVWIICGCLSVIGTIAFGIAFSVIIRPALLERYLYPSAIILWISIGVLLSKHKHNYLKFLGALACIVLTVALCAPCYYDTYVEEVDNNGLCETTRHVLCDYINEHDDVITNNLHLYRTGLRYYVPDRQCEYYWTFDNYTDEKYWIVWDRRINDEEESFFTGKGYTITTMYEEGLMGDVPVYLYCLELLDEEE